MYRLELLEQVKLRTAPPAAAPMSRVDPVVWTLGLTSFLTDISAEMVVSVLPIYLVLQLRMNPLEYGAIDGIYNGAAIALLSLAAGLIADRTRRHKEAAAAGYGLSAICKLLLLAGTTWGWIAAATALDRAGKGTRTAPRDALISMHSTRDALASSFAVHRALDAGGSLAGPLVAFAMLSRMPGAFDAVWATSFVFALLGLTILWLFIGNPSKARAAGVRPVTLKEAAALLAGRRFRALAGAGALLSFATISDGFLYMTIQQRGHLTLGFFPMLYVITAGCYMLFSLPIGHLADSWGRAPVLLAGYGVVGVIDILLVSSPALSRAGVLGCLILFGLSYAATEGVLTAMASAVIPAELRTSGLALLATFAGLANFASSLLFGWLWQARGLASAVSAFGLALAAGLLIAARWLHVTHDATPI
jgi:MFS family permease